MVNQDHQDYQDIQVKNLITTIILSKSIIWSTNQGNVLIVASFWQINTFKKTIYLVSFASNVKFINLCHLTFFSLHLNNCYLYFQEVISSQEFSLELLDDNISFLYFALCLFYNLPKVFYRNKKVQKILQFYISWLMLKKKKVNKLFGLCGVLYLQI